VIASRFKWKHACNHVFGRSARVLGNVRRHSSDIENLKKTVIFQIGALGRLHDFLPKQAWSQR
jgi:hypothetical protein